MNSPLAEGLLWVVGTGGLARTLIRMSTLLAAVRQLGHRELEQKLKGLPFMQQSDW